MALWYKNSGPWWDSSNIKPNDGISYEEQKNDSASLYNYYKTLMRLRKSNEALQTGSYNSVANNNDNVFSFSRKANNQHLLVTINLSAQKQEAKMNLNVKNYSALLAQTKNQSPGQSIVLAPYEVQVWKLD